MRSWFRWIEKHDSRRSDSFFFSSGTRHKNRNRNRNRQKIQKSKEIGTWRNDGPRRKPWLNQSTLTFPPRWTLLSALSRCGALASLTQKDRHAGLGLHSCVCIQKVPIPAQTSLPEPMRQPRSALSSAFFWPFARPNSGPSAYLRSTRQDQQL